MSKTIGNLKKQFDDFIDVQQDYILNYQKNCNNSIVGNILLTNMKKKFAKTVELRKSLEKIYDNPS